MTPEIRYPDEPAGPFPRPPRSVTDSEGRDVEFRAVDADAPTPQDADAGVREALVAMYDDFDPGDRAQGLPPVGEERVRGWLDVLLDGYNVVAWHDGAAVGHATLVPDEAGQYELAIFVAHEYQGAGIGTELVETLLGHGKESGVERVWLTVERYNRAAVHLYEKVGFEVAGAETFDMEMALRLA